MLVYSRVLGETAPEAFVFADNDPTVADLLDRAAAAGSAKGRLVELDLDGALSDAKLRDLASTAHCPMPSCATWASATETWWRCVRSANHS